MYLKSIEVQGFKSFANKILFEFHDGITGIVGPNGSGKSNVSDAVRWVLGEQSAKQLRGAKMEDVIFSGTESRKAQGFAYVAITLDNKEHKLPIDYEEVKVARRVYRSGESEYLINGGQCRLRDVQELFLDTGIGKEGYSIIGQGQIDRIISGKPEEKRELFDEAAGIVKFKKRKATAQKNLEEEQLNLQRINDILEEREKQIVPLQKQSEVAREYLKFKDELKKQEVNMFLLQYEKYKEQKDKLEEKINIADEDFKSTKTRYENTKEEYGKLEEEIEVFTQSINDKRILLNDSKLQKETLEGDIKVLNEQILSIGQSSEQSKGRVDKILFEIEEKKGEREKYIKQKQEIDEKLDNIDDLQTNEQNKLEVISDNIKRMKEESESRHAQIIEILNDSAGVKGKMQRYETILEQNQIKKAQLNQKLLRNKSDDLEQEELISKTKKEHTKINESVTQLQAENVKMIDRSKEVQDKINEHSSMYNLKQQDYHREKSKLDTLKNITERYEGYGISIKKIMEQKEKKEGIQGVVADIIKVKKEHEIAIEIALGGNIQNIVTDNEQTAKDLIIFLKQNKFGRATFLPLTGIQNRATFLNENALKEKGVIGIASSLVKSDDKYENLIKYLLGRIIIVDNIDNAVSLAKKYNQSLRIVTLEGEYLSPGGSMSGGAYKNASNLLSRRREIEEFEKKVLDLEKSMDLLQKNISEEKENKQILKEKLENNKLKIQELHLTLNTVEHNIKQIEEKRKENLILYKEYESELFEIEKQIEELIINIKDLQELLQTNDNKSKENEERINDINKSLDSEVKLEEEYRIKNSDLKMELSSLEQNSQYILENIKRIKAELEKLKEERNILKQNMENAQTQITAKKQVKTDLENRIESEENIITVTEEELKKLTKECENISKNHKDFFAKREEESSRINELDKELFRLNSQIEKVTEQMDTDISYMWEEYELTYIGALPSKDDSIVDLSEIKKQVTKLKASIRELGDVNVNAIEDYKELVESYEFLKNQRDDLVTAKETLQDIITDLDARMRIQFLEKFEEIKEQFNQVFKELFGGGKGTIELLEDEDILEAGIKIIAQPPGKKLQNMMQLSGGEKALTAISLLFAIQNLKPSPFCLLDEIEAALDDSNVKRFAKYLNKLTKDTQFIIITHRRGTMAAADTLYGITMQEKGVSTLVSVNLVENDLK